VISDGHARVDTLDAALPHIPDLGCDQIVSRGTRRTSACSQVVPLELTLGRLGTEGVVQVDYCEDEECDATHVPTEVGGTGRRSRCTRTPPTWRCAR